MAGFKTKEGTGCWVGFDRLGPTPRVTTSTPAQLREHHAVGVDKTLQRQLNVVQTFKGDCAGIQRGPGVAERQSSDNGVYQ